MSKSPNVREHVRESIRSLTVPFNRVMLTRGVSGVRVQASRGTIQRVVGELREAGELVRNDQFGPFARWARPGVSDGDPRFTHTRQVTLMRKVALEQVAPFRTADLIDPEQGCDAELAEWVLTECVNDGAIVPAGPGRFEPMAFHKLAKDVREYVQNGPGRPFTAHDVIAACPRLGPGDYPGVVCELARSARQGARDETGEVTWTRVGHDELVVAPDGECGEGFEGEGALLEVIDEPWLADVDALIAERDEALRSIEALRSDFALVIASHDEMCMERDALRAQVDRQRGELGQASARESLLRERAEELAELLSRAPRPEEVTARDARIDELLAARDELRARLKRKARAEQERASACLVAPGGALDELIGSGAKSRGIKPELWLTLAVAAFHEAA